MSSGLPASILLKYKKDADCFVETGTGYGETVMTAIKYGNFSRIYSLEKDVGLSIRAQDLFQNYSNVFIMTGNSVDSLAWLINSNAMSFGKFIFWFDAYKNHDKEENPLIKEIEQISKINPDNIVAILINNVSLFGVCEWKNITKERIESELMKIKNFKITYETNNHTEGDILIAHTE